MPTSAFLLVGGLGTRLRAVVSDRPKPLAAVAGRPFLARLLDQLDAAGVRHAVLCTGHRGEQVEAALGSRYRGLELEYSPEDAPLGTGGALQLAAPRARGDRALVLNGDSYLSLDLRAFSEWDRARACRASMAVVRVADAQRYGRVELDAAGLVRSFEEKGGRAGGGLVNAGVYAVDVAALAALAPGPRSLERDVFPAWAGAIAGYVVEAPFIDIGTPESYRAAEQFFA